MKRVAIVYDRVNSRGGAEKVLLALHRLYPQAPLYTSVYDSDSTPWTQGWEVRTSWLQRLPWARRRHQLFGWIMPFVFLSLNLSEFDLVISVTSEAAKFVRTNPNQRHVCYLLTPTRYLWSHSREYERQFPVWLRWFVRMAFSALRWIDRWAARQPDVLIPISQRVGERAQKYYRRPVEEPVYPPVRPLGRAKKPVCIPKGRFLFTWGRHVAYKRFDLIIRAAVATNTPLVLGGRGPDTPRLEQLVQHLDPAGRLIHLVGEIGDGEVLWYLRHALGAVFPQEEDFGLVIMEAQLAGCPVIVHCRSGAAELVVSEKTALLLENGRPRTLVNAIRRLRRKTWRRLDITRTASQYAGAYFARQWRQRLRDTTVKEKHDGKLS